MKKVAIIGSTGSIGRNTLKIINHLKDQFKVVGLAAGKNDQLLQQQVEEFNPDLVALYDEEKATSRGWLSGMEGVCEVAQASGADIVVSAMTGTLGLAPTMAAISAGIDIGLANKEALVSGGALVMEAAKKNNCRILPIDSEHSAIFQCLNGEDEKAISRIILTSSGGPFREKSREELQHATIEQALEHPTWNMGSKITIDSSTLMNKGLEVIEAHWLFGVPLEKIDVVIHPQSIIHSMVEFHDGSIMAQMGIPTMITPIQYALTYPDRQPGILEPFNFAKHQSLEFMIPDRQVFKCLDLAYQAISEGGSMPCFMNAANEILVHRSLAKEILWIEISQKLEKLMQSHRVQEVSSFEEIFEVDILARKEAQVI